MSDSVTLTGNSRPWGGQVLGDSGPYTEREWHYIYRTLFDGSGNRGPLLDAAGTQLQVTERGAGANMTIDIAPGTCIIDGVWATSTSTVNLVLPPSDPVQERYSLVFAYWDAATQITRLRVVDGVLGGGSCESVSNYQTANVEWAIPLACVHTAALAASIVNADITDLREFCRFRFSPEDLVDGTMLTTDATTHLIEIAPAGVGVNEIAAAIAGAGLVGGAGSALDVSGAALAGAGLVSPGGAVLDVNPDGLTTEINADTVRIAATAAGAGLGGGGAAALSVNVDAATIVIAGDTLEVGTIDNSHMTDRTRVEYIGAGALYPSVANPPTWGAIGAQPVPAEGWICATGVDDYVIGHWQSPSNLVTGNVTIIIVWSHVAAANQVARLRFDYINALTCTGDLTGGTTSIVDDTNALIVDANKRMCTTLSTTVAMAANQYLDFFVGRNGAHVNDTYALSATLLGVGFSYTADM